MNKINLFKIISVIIITGIASCAGPMTPDEPNTNNLGVSNEEDNSSNEIALGLLKTFSEKVNEAKTKSFDFSDVYVKKVETNYLKFQANQKSALTKSVNVDSVSIPLMTYTFEKNGKEGFAIISPDERVNKVLFYCENGRLEDTTRFEEAGFLIKCIPNMVANELNNYYNQTQTKTVIIDGVLMDEWNLRPCIKTKWGFDAPYNNNYKAANCTTTGNAKYPASPIAVALAQCVANYPFPPDQLTAQYDVESFISKEQISNNDKDAAKVAKLMKTFDDDVYLHTKFSCNRTQTLMAYAKGELHNLGFVEGKHYVYTSKENDIKTQMYLRFNCATIYEGALRSNVNKTFAWIVDGMWFYLDTKMTKIEVNGYHCCWGRGNGEFDSWYGSAFYPEGATGNPLFSTPFDVQPNFLHFRPICPWCTLPSGF